MGDLTALGNVETPARTNRFAPGMENGHNGNQGTVKELLIQLPDEYMVVDGRVLGTDPTISYQ